MNALLKRSDLFLVVCCADRIVCYHQDMKVMQHAYMLGMINTCRQRCIVFASLHAGVDSQGTTKQEVADGVEGSSEGGIKGSPHKRHCGAGESGFTCSMSCAQVRD
jgi:hypothetical protein